MMRKYIQQRILCDTCGRYDRRLKHEPKVIFCDHCGGEAELMQVCRGKGKLEVPWIGRPMAANDAEFIPGTPKREHWRTKQSRLRSLNRDEAFDKTREPVRADEVNELLGMLQ